jgi:AraC-like DNA-binding protein
MNIIIALGAFPGLLFATIKILNKKEDLSNKTLGFAIFFYSLMLLLVFLGKQVFTTHAKELIVAANLFIPVSLPVFYFYILLITGSVEKISKKVLKHFLPFAGYAVFFIVPLLFFNDLSDLFFKLSFAYTLSVSSFYSILMLKEIVAYQRKMVNYSTDENSVKIFWIKTSVFVWIFINVLQIFVVLMKDNLLLNYPVLLEVHSFVLNIATVSWIYIFAYFAISYPDIFAKSKKMAQSLQEEKNTSQPSINDEYAEIIDSRLQKIMKEKKPYLDHDLNIATLCEMINVQPYLLGRFINSRLDKNFMTYINEFRIQEVISMFSNTEFDNKTILEISLLAGFKSKSAFNSFFKKSTGKTPLEYRKSLKP